MTIARVAGAFYLLTFVTGMIAVAAGANMAAANGIATVAYVVVTVLFSGKAHSRSGSCSDA